MINNKSILITGGTGSFGTFLTNFLLKKYKPKKIIIFSRDELKQSQMMTKFKNNERVLRFFIGDVRDFPRLKLAMKDVDFVFHAAALKHVPLAEYNPFEAVKTNILGAQNVIDAAYENNVDKVLALSTDKASSPVNIYGATKLASDKLFIAANNYRGKFRSKFSVVRYGNVMGSRGSVVPVFSKLLKSKYFPITDERMTRFNITLEEAIEFVINSSNIMQGGEIFVPKIPSFRVTDLAKAFDYKKKIKIIGIRPGEKLHEEMISVGESMNTIEFKNSYIICPQSENIIWDKKFHLKKKLGSKSFPENISYNSGNNKHFLSIKDLQKILRINKLI
jgi:UDP-N-acetylglucosamine 4,6-dehydratase